MDDIDQEIDLDQITDENLLQSLLDQTDDPEDRKVIRDRIKELKASKKTERDEKLTKLTNTREEMLQAKKKEAETHKQKTMQMYDNMAKSAPAGDHKKLDTTILKSETSTTKTTTSTSSKTVSSSNNNDFGANLTFGPKVDLVEDAIKKRQREAEERKKRILAAFDVASKTGPAGAPKDVDFEVAKKIDIAQYEQTKSQQGGATFQMAGGVPVVKNLTIQTPTSPIEKPNFPEMDCMERALRERQRECEERKRKILEQYSQISKEAAGPKVWTTRV